MNDEEYKAQVARLDALMEQWHDNLGLKWWRVTHEYVREASHFQVDGKDSPDTAACARADWRYMEATISWNIPIIATFDDERLENVYLHECCHILINETRGPSLKAFMAHEERVCSLLAKSFIWVRDAARGKG